MKLRIFATVLLLISTLGVDLTHAQTQQLNEEELNKLCTQFPLNSQCLRLKDYIALQEQTDYKAKCLFKFGDKKRKRECQVLVTEQGLTVSFEEDDPIDLVSGTSRDRQLKIPFNQIFALSSQQWDGTGKFWGTSKEFLNVEIGFVNESTLPSGNRSNILTIFVDEKFQDTLNSLTSINTAPKILLDNSVAAQLTTVEPVKDNSSQIKQLLETRQCIKCDLRGANLEKAKLEGVNLEGANLEGANLEGANLKGAYLVGANLSKANLRKAQLETAKLIVADLSEANLQNADLQGVNLQGANLQNANLSNSRLIAPTMMQDANLQNANLSRAKLDGANLERANLENANLEKASLRRITESIDPDTNRSERSRGILAGSIFDSVDRGSFRTGRFRFQTNLSKANLQGANLSGANLSRAILNETNLQEANLTGTKLKERDLANANICGVTMPDGSRSDRTCQ